MRVLQVVNALGMGGAETWLMELLRLWSKSREIHVDFLLTSGNRGLFDDEALSLGSKLFYCRYGRNRLWQFRREFRDVLRQGAYDALHDHQDYASGWHFLMGAGCLPKVRITHVHNPAYQIRFNYGVTMKRRMTARVGKRLVRHYATHITGTSRQAVDEHGFDEPGFAKVSRQALHCGFDPDRFSGNREAVREALCEELGWPRDAKILLFAGRMDRGADLGHPQNHKNSGFAVNLAIASAARDPQIHMVMCGAPSVALPVLQARIDRAELSGRIVIAGIRKDIERFMKGANLLLFPSRGEGLGMVAVEAQAAGLPVLASTAVPSECEVVDGMVRFLDVSDDMTPWLDAIDEALDSAKFDHSACNLKVAASPFAIRNSASFLAAIYSGASGFCVE